MKSRYANLAVIAVAAACIGATSPARGPAGRDMHRSSVATSAHADPSASRAMMRLRALLATPKHRSPSERRSVAIANTKNATTYHVVDLQGSLPDNSVLYPLGVSDGGKIIGLFDGYAPYVRNADGTGYNLDVPTDAGLGTYQVYPMSINSSGQAAGGGYVLTEPPSDPSDPTAPSTYFYGGIIWTLTAAPSNQLLTPESIFSVANQNIGVGASEYSTSAGVTGELATNACGRKPIIAQVINDSGVIAGSASGNDPVQVMKIGSCPTALPNLPPGRTYPEFITKNGDLVIYEPQVPYDDVLWRRGAVYHIPVPSGYDASSARIAVTGINSSDMIVGSYDVLKKRPFFYANGKSVDLAALFPPNSGWSPATASGINDAGEIIGVGYYNGSLRGFALVP